MPPKGMSYAIACNFLFTVLVVFISPILFDALHGGIFIIFGIAMVLVLLNSL